MESLPLAGVRVVDLTVVWAGPFATMLLADLGAEVIKVENIHIWQPSTRGNVAHPTADSMLRGMAWNASYPGNVPGDRPWNRNSNSVHLYRNKRSVTMDLRTPAGRQPFEELIRTADVVYENNVSSTMEKLGITDDYLRALRPDIIYLRSPAYGSTGAYRNFRAFGVHLEGVAGHSLLRRYPDLDPSTNAQIFSGDFFAGSHGAFAVMAALHHRQRTGAGQLIELPQVETATGMLAQAMMDYSLNHRVSAPLGNRDAHGAAPCGVYRCASLPVPADLPPSPDGSVERTYGDRWLALTVGNDAQWQAVATELRHPEWATDPRFASAPARRDHQDELDGLLAAAARERDRDELAHALQARGVAAGPVLPSRDAFHDPHLRARGVLVTREQVDCGVYDWPGPFLRDADGPLPYRRPPVAMGEDNAHVYQELLGYAADRYAALVAAGHIGDRFDDDLP